MAGYAIPQPGTNAPRSVFRQCLVTTHNDGTARGSITTPYLWFGTPWVPAGVSRVRVILTTINWTTGLLHAAFTTDIAVGQPNNTSNGWASAPTVQSGISISAAGSRSQWFNVTRNATTGRIGIAAYLPSGLTTDYGYVNTLFGYVNTNSSDVTNLPSLVATDGTNSTSIPFGVVLELDVSGVSSSVKRIVEIGDSLVPGLGSSPPGLESALYKLGQQRNVLWNPCGSGGQAFGTFNDIGRPHVQISYCDIKGNIVLFELGTNDVPSNSFLNQMDQITADIRSRGPAELWLATIPPKAGDTDPDRTSFNEAIRGGAYDADYILDRDLILRDAGTPSQMQAAYKQADGIHMTAAAYTAMANQLIADGKV